MNQSIKDNPIRSLLAVAIMAYTMIFMSYVVVVHGDDAGILQLLIGFVMGGSMVGSVMGVYFSSSDKPPVPKTGETTVAKVVATITKSDD